MKGLIFVSSLFLSEIIVEWMSSSKMKKQGFLHREMGHVFDGFNKRKISKFCKAAR